jgi:hypothetical protein
MPSGVRYGLMTHAERVRKPADLARNRRQPGLFSPRLRTGFHGTDHQLIYAARRLRSGIRGRKLPVNDAGAVRPDQKSGLSAVGIAASVPGNHWVFSAQTNSGHSINGRP